MPLSTVQINKQLLQYGTDPSSLSNRQLQQKIMAFYDLIHIKVQDNMLLKKQNLDIQLQITTIKDLFKRQSLFNKTDNFKDFSTSPDQRPDIQQQIIFSPHRLHQSSRQQSDPINDKNDISHKNDLQNSNWTLNGKAQNTERKAGNNKGSYLEQKIEKLFCKNQQILERLEQIEESINDESIKERQKNGFMINEKGQIEYGLTTRTKPNYYTNQKGQRTSTYKRSSAKTATSRSSLNGKMNQN